MGVSTAQENLTTRVNITKEDKEIRMKVLSFNNITVLEIYSLFSLVFAS